MRSIGVLALGVMLACDSVEPSAPASASVDATAGPAPRRGSDSPDPPEPPEPSYPPPISPPPQTFHAPGPPVDGADELHRLERVAERPLLDELGPPDREREFPMTKCCSEFQIELYNTYGPELPEPQREQIRIRELTWSYGDYSLTVWLHAIDDEWVVLETSRYSKDVEF